MRSQRQHRYLILKRGAGAKPGVDQKPIENLRDRIHDIDIGREEDSGLRFPNGENAFRPRWAEQRAGLLPNRTPGLAENIVGVRVARVIKDTIARRVRLPDRQTARLSQRPTVQARLLSQNRDVSIAASRQLAVKIIPIGRRVGDAADVQPLHYHSSVELGAIDKTHDDEARLIGSAALDFSAAVRAFPIGRGHSVDETLFHHVARRRLIKESHSYVMWPGTGSLAVWARAPTAASIIPIAAPTPAKTSRIFSDTARLAIGVDKPLFYRRRGAKCMNPAFPWNDVPGDHWRLAYSDCDAIPRSTQDRENITPAQAALSWLLASEWAPL